MDSVVGAGMFYEYTWEGFQRPRPPTIPVSARNPNISQPMLINSLLNNNPCDKANFAADYFSKAMANNFSLQPSDMQINIIYNLIFVTPSEDPLLSTNNKEVADILHSLNIKKAPGPDPFSNKILKILANSSHFVNLFTNLFNTCLQIHYFPDSWKLGTIILFLKTQKDPLLINNYRPITLLSSLSKVFEKIILQHITLHIRGSTTPANNSVPNVAVLTLDRIAKNQVWRSSSSSAVSLLVTTRNSGQGRLGNGPGFFESMSAWVESLHGRLTGLFLGVEPMFRPLSPWPSSSIMYPSAESSTVLDLLVPTMLLISDHFDLKELVRMYEKRFLK
ncbi:hypothetical protein J437_LFUL018735 [Ladona fulva]|uniref:RNA-directed DNA polymerase from mobile element jockey n=1 Tax=Ladona fulva TaxID=123851 RepID=A0A8K0PAD4_LADFU|nr:hypothetical protein J437_LFUL018735 [Ladona fulva]